MAGTGNGVIRAKLEMHPSPRDLQRIFEKGGVEFGDWKPAFRRMVAPLTNALLAVVQSRGAGLEDFKVKGGVSGGNWPAGSPEYIARKLREGGGNVPLVRSGRMTTQLMRQPRGLTKRSLSIGLGGKVAAFAAALQFKRGYVFIGWTGRMREDAQRLLLEHIDDVLRRISDNMARAA